MRIIRTDEEYKAILEREKKIKIQRKKCPICGIKRNFFVRFSCDVWEHRTFIQERQSWFKCTCHKCGAQWETDWL